jgi:hypothetical protein
MSAPPAVLADKCQSPSGTRTVHPLAWSVTHEVVSSASALSGSPAIAVITGIEHAP